MKTEQEQVEEMGKTMCEEFRTNLCGNECECANEFIAEKLYSAGYRKASDVIDEFVERFLKSTWDKSIAGEYGRGFSDCNNIVERIAAEMRQEVEK